MHLRPGSEPLSGAFRVVQEAAGPVLQLSVDVDEPLVRRMRADGMDETGLRGRGLWQTLSRASRRLTAPSADVGSGIPLAPQ